MDPLTLALLLVAAGVHSIWNLLAKRAADQQVFLWLALLAAAALYAVPWVLTAGPIGAPGWAFILGSGVLEAGYFIALGQTYRRGDLSGTYPLIRGTAILTATALAALALGERLAPAGIAGIALVLGGMYTVHVRALTRAGLLAPLAALRAAPSRFAAATGLLTGVAAVVDKAGIRYVSPFTYLYLVFLVAALLLAPAMLTARRAALRREWARNKGPAIAVGFMFLAAYLLVLFALQRGPVGYVAAVREIAVVFAALLGTLVLREPFGRPKVAGAVLIFMGILGIALAP